MIKIKQLKIAVMAAVCLLLSGACTKKVYVPVENTIYHVDTLRQITLRNDSVFLHDSICTYINGDTVIVTKFHDRLHYRTRFDTVYHTVTDTARITVPYIANCQHSRWQQAKISFGGWAMAGLGVAVLFFALIWLRKRC